MTNIISFCTYSTNFILSFQDSCTPVINNILYLHDNHTLYLVMLGGIVCILLLQTIFVVYCLVHLVNLMYSDLSLGTIHSNFEVVKTFEGGIQYLKSLKQSPRGKRIEIITLKLKVTDLNSSKIACAKIKKAYVDHKWFQENLPHNITMSGLYRGNINVSSQVQITQCLIYPSRWSIREVHNLFQNAIDGFVGKCNKEKLDSYELTWVAITMVEI